MALACTIYADLSLRAAGSANASSSLGEGAAQDPSAQADVAKGLISL